MKAYAVELDGTMYFVDGIYRKFLHTNFTFRLVRMGGKGLYYHGYDNAYDEPAFRMKVLRSLEKQLSKGDMFSDVHAYVVDDDFNLIGSEMRMDGYLNCYNMPQNMRNNGRVTNAVPSHLSVISGGLN